MDRRSRRTATCAALGLAAVLACLCGAAAFPVRISCGHVNYACATAPDPTTGQYRVYYEWEPLAVTAIEMLTGENYGIYYSSGHESHPTP